MLHIQHLHLDKDPTFCSLSTNAPLQLLGIVASTRFGSMEILEFLE